MTADVLPILGRIPSGVFILTAKHGPHETGMLASWVQQAGFEPPTVTIAVNQKRYITEWMEQNSHVVLNVVRGDQMNLLKHFGKGFDLGQGAFDGLKIERDPHGVAVLADSLGHLECQVVRHIDSGDHRIFLAEVTGGRLSGDGAPLVHIRKSGGHY